MLLEQRRQAMLQLHLSDQHFHCITRFFLYYRFDRFLNTLRMRQNGRHFPDNIFKCIFLKEDVWILIMILLKFVPNVQINNIPALVQIMAWRRPGDKPLSEPMIFSLLMHLCITRPQQVKYWEKTHHSSPKRTRYGCHFWVQCLIYSTYFLLCCYVNGLVQDCSNSSALAMESQQYCTKPSMCNSLYYPIIIYNAIIKLLDCTHSLGDLLVSWNY